MPTPHPLDHVVWEALTSTQRDLSTGDDAAKRYLPTIAPFGAIRDESPESWRSLSALTAATGRITLLRDRHIEPPADFEVVRRGVLVQMLLPEFRAGVPVDAVRLGAADVADMLELVALTQPGPFEAETYRMGAYYGLRIDGRLAAMAGERMRLPGFTEVSAVCTHPDHRKKGYGEALMNHVAAGIVERGDTPFLHVFRHNEGAISLYRRLGYVERYEFHLLGVASRSAAA